MLEILLGILIDFATFFSIRSKKGRIHAAALFLVTIAILAFVIGNRGTEEEATDITTRTVFVDDVASLQSNSSFSIVGTVASQSQAKLQAESSGRVTSVTVSLGDTVRAGQVIATLENAAEYASVLQAEGAYDAAVAAANVGDVSVRSADTSRGKCQPE